MRCSTEGSTGVLLSDLRKVERPGAWIVAPWAMLVFGQLQFFMTVKVAHNSGVG